MTTEQIKSSIAPCGLSCEKCFAHVNGDIRRYSLKLKEKLGNFDNYAKRYETCWVIRFLRNIMKNHKTPQVCLKNNKKP